MGIEKHVVEAQTWPLKLRCCAKRSAFCEEYNGDSEDARRPVKNLQKPSNNFQTHVHLYVYTCTAH
eukprot:903023-Heterocapsa_arctica.AAC.1